jgi:GT2 family glycosyltransferase
MGVRRDVFESVGGWDENMGWGHEEKELADRVRSEYEILYDPQLVVVHPYADSVLDLWRKKYRLETQSPYYWGKCGDTVGEQVRRTILSAITPQHYARYDAVGTVVQIGVQLGKTAGRIRGLINQWDTAQQDVGGVPFFDQQPTSKPEPSKQQ